MFKKNIFIILLFISSLGARENSSIEEVLKTNYEESNITITKKSLILTKKEATLIQTTAHAKVRSNLIRYYTIEKEKKLLGHAVLLKQRVRTKRVAVLYMVDANKTMIGLEILSFKEPSEYKPHREWQNIFVGKTSEDRLIAGKDVATISGATLSARVITESARVALAIVTTQL
jgi:hypothetical protein